MSISAPRTPSTRPLVPLMLPTFIVIGAMKAGTTSLYGYLDSHPDVFMAQPKELDFFVTGKNWERGLEWYQQRFSGAREVQARGEVSPSYTKADVFPNVPERMAAVVPAARLIYLVRHPIARLQSMYLHEVAAGRESRPFARAVVDDPHYVTTSRYAAQLDRYRDLFPREQLLVITSEALKDRRADTLRDVFGFISVDSTWQPAALGEERGRSADRQALPAAWTRVKSAPGAASLRRVLPQGLLQRAGRAVRRPLTVEGDAAISEDLRGWLVDQLADDVQALKEYLSPDAIDAWGLRT